MELLISGYGPAGRKNLVKCDADGKVIWADTVESPSFICLCGDMLFAGTENDAYAIFTAYVKDGNGYRKTDSLRFDGVGCLCHICYSAKHAMLFGACWGTGHLIYATVDKNGRFCNSGKLLQVNETGDDTLLTRAHFVYVNRAEDTLMVNNVGLDIIYFYAIENGTVQEKDRIYTERGQHPRHSVYNHDESLLYVVTELSNEVLVYAMPEKKLLQRITTLPNGFAGKSHCSAICLSPDEKTLYAANRYSESLVYFKVGADGLLSEALREPTEAEKPRHMILASNGLALVVCYQVSSEVYIKPLGEDGLPLPGAAVHFPFAEAACAADVG